MEVLSRSRSESEIRGYRKKGGRIEHNVRKSQQGRGSHDENLAPSEMGGLLPALPSAVPSSRAQGIVPLSRWSERPSDEGIGHNKKLPVGGSRQSRRTIWWPSTTA